MCHLYEARSQGTLSAGRRHFYSTSRGAPLRLAQTSPGSIRSAGSAGGARMGPPKLVGTLARRSPPAGVAAAVAWCCILRRWDRRVSSVRRRSFLRRPTTYWELSSWRFKKIFERSNRAAGSFTAGGLRTSKGRAQWHTGNSAAYAGFNYPFPTLHLHLTPWLHRPARAGRRCRFSTCPTRPPPGCEPHCDGHRGARFPD